MADSPTQLITVSSRDLTAELDPQGAQLSALRDREGGDLLWSGDPKVWAGRAPLLFPIVGTLAGGQYRLGTEKYALPRHGFARTKRFEILESTAAAATFRLASDTSSFTVYPFQFEMDVRFEVRNASLLVTAVLRNVGTTDLPASFGFHPGFRWPLPYGQPRSSHFIEFAIDEPAPIRRLNSAGLLDPKPYATPIVDRRLALEDELFQNDVVILDQVRSRSVTYGAAAGPRLQVSFPDSPYLGFWSKPGAGFICIEPWHGVADPAGFDGDFKLKPGVFIVAHGSEFRIEMTISLV